MNILLSGPISTASLDSVLGDVSSLPKGSAPTPVNVLAVEYVRKGHNVHLVTLDSSISERVQVSKPGLTVVYLPERRRARDLAFSFFEPEIYALKQEYEAAKPDIVHAHWTYEFAEAGARTKIPLLVTSHDSPWKTAWIEADAYRFFRLLMALRTVPRIKNLTVVAPYLSNHMRCSGYFGKIHVIPNGLDLADWPYKPKAIPTISPVIAAIGNRLPLKNIGAALAAYSLVREQVPTSELHLFGPGLDQYKKKEGVFVHGMVPNNALREFHLSRTSILVHPSRQEVCPVSIIEARALGIPVVAGIDSGGVPYVMGNTVPGLVDINDPKKIAEAVLSILSDGRIYERLCVTGRADVELRFDIQRVAECYLNIYQEILSY